MPYKRVYKRLTVFAFWNGSFRLWFYRDSSNFKWILFLVNVAIQAEIIMYEPSTSLSHFQKLSKIGGIVIWNKERKLPLCERNLLFICSDEIVLANFQIHDGKLKLQRCFSPTITLKSIHAPFTVSIISFYKYTVST